MSTQKPVLARVLGEKTDRHPIWFLRQAGRYLPEYQQIRQKLSFVELCQSPTLAAEVTLQPLRRFDLDAAIIFSDILILPTILGFQLKFDAGHGPILNPTVRSPQQVAQIKLPSHVNDLHYVGEALSIVKPKLADYQTLIGFAGAPFTVASYLIEGKGSKTFTEVKRLAFNHPTAFVELQSKIAQMTFDYLVMQQQAGAEVFMLFDSWASHFSGKDYRELIFPVVSQLIDKLESHGLPTIYYPGQGVHTLYHLQDIKTRCLAIDWRTSLTQAEKILSPLGLHKTLQGNFDPQYLLGPQEFIRTKAHSILQEVDQLQVPHIFNVGHGLLPHTPIDALSYLIQCIRDYQ